MGFLEGAFVGFWVGATVERLGEALGAVIGGFDGRLDGALLGVIEGALVGATEGEVVGDGVAPLSDGLFEIDGCPVGSGEGFAEGTAVGTRVGTCVGATVGCKVGEVVVGVLLGVSDGLMEGLCEGEADGLFEGVDEGAVVGLSDGVAEGAPVGLPMFWSGSTRTEKEAVVTCTRLLSCNSSTNIAPLKSPGRKYSGSWYGKLTLLNKPMRSEVVSFFSNCLPRRLRVWDWVERSSRVGSSARVKYKARSSVWFTPSKFVTFKSCVDK